MDNQRCEKCLYYYGSADYAYGSCQRYPPTFFFTNNGVRYDAFAEVNETDWCGEFVLSGRFTDG